MAALFLVAAGVACADDRLKNSNAQWHAQDNCTRQAFQKYPDYTQEGATKRDAYVRQCLRTGRLPPRTDLATPQQ